MDINGLTQTSETRWHARIDRERRARFAAEALLEAKSRELYDANQALLASAAVLEERVVLRTRQLEQARQRALRLAEQDSLTGLSNRLCFSRMLGEAVATARVDGSRVDLLLIDVDGFKEINDTQGHEAGDAFLQAVAAILKEQARPEVFVARLGGDEFAVIVKGPDDDTSPVPLAETILSGVRCPVVHRDHLLRSSCSIGIASFPANGLNEGDLQRFADIALYRSKALGRGRVTQFDLALKAAVEDRRLLADDFRRAIGTEQILPYFQPIMASATGRVIGVEVLARWMHPTRGLVMPEIFIRLAEEQGMTDALFSHQLRQSCRIVSPWIDRGLVDSLSINVSPSQFRSGTLVDRTLDILAATGVDPSSLRVEITEELLLSDLERTSLQLDALAASGVRIALDDFGNGYSNISYLRRLPIHTLKLDRLLTNDVCGDERARSILQGILAIARALGLEVVAEGVEDQDQAAALTMLGCDLLQGYFLGRPVPEGEFITRIIEPANQQQAFDRSLGSEGRSEPRAHWCRNSPAPI